MFVWSLGPPSSPDAAMFLDTEVQTDGSTERWRWVEHDHVSALVLAPELKKARSCGKQVQDASCSR